jgi:hypothetical protein
MQRWNFSPSIDTKDNILTELQDAVVLPLEALNSIPVNISSQQ